MINTMMENFTNILPNFYQCREFYQYYHLFSEILVADHADHADHVIHFRFSSQYLKWWSF